MLGDTPCTITRKDGITPVLTSSEQSTIFMQIDPVSLTEAALIHAKSPLDVFAGAIEGVSVDLHAGDQINDASGKPDPDTGAAPVYTVAGPPLSIPSLLYQEFKMIRFRGD
jgi:hypothetical protein